MGVQIGSLPNGFYLDEDELIRRRAWGDQGSWTRVIDLVDSLKAPRLPREYGPGCLIGLEDKFWEVLGAFRLVEEPHVWRYVCQQIPDLGTDRNVPADMDELGFDWAVVLPRVVYFLFHTEGDARWFFRCLFAKWGLVRIVRNQEMRSCKVLVKVTWSATDIHVPQQKALARPQQPALPSG